MRFSEVLDSMREQSGVWTVQVPDHWTQGRSVFGGLQAAFAVRAMRALLPAPLPLRTLQVTFVAPVPPGEVRLQVRLLRTGRNAVQLEARIADGDETRCIAVGIFGNLRESRIARLPQQPRVDAAKPIEFRFIPGITPEFTRHFSSRWLRGGLPYSGSTLPEMVVETGIDDAGPASELHAIAIADLIPPVALTLLKKPAAGSSMTWMLEFLTDRFDSLALKGWRVDAEMVAATGGYTSQSVIVWGPGGVPVALSQQNMVVFG
jgi:acyl-coenzyme A thioesterase PaaI-like protein